MERSLPSAQKIIVREALWVCTVPELGMESSTSTHRKKPALVGLIRLSLGSIEVFQLLNLLPSCIGKIERVSCLAKAFKTL